MAKQPESRLKEKVLKDLKTIPNTYFIKIQQVVIRGTPDILACVSGRFVAIELKKDSTHQPDMRQDYELNKIKKAGGLGFVVTPANWEEVFCILRYSHTSWPG